MKKRKFVILTSNGSNEKYKRNSVVDRRFIKKLNRKGLLVKVGTDYITVMFMKKTLSMEKYNTMLIGGILFMIFYNKEELQGYERDLLKYKLSS